MEISDFSSLIEVGVTLNIACVAVEYVKSYTSVLCNQVFSLKSTIEDSCQKCIDILIDETTIQNLPNTNVNGANTDIIKIRLISRRKTLIASIKSKEQELKEKIKRVCEVKNISSICLWLSLYGLTALVLIGFETKEAKADNSLIHVFWASMSAFSLLFSSIGWIFGNKEQPLLGIIDYGSLRFAIYTFLLCSFISAGGMYIEKQAIIDFVNDNWRFILIFSMALLYSNFVSSAIEIRNRAKQGKNEIVKDTTALREKCEKLNGQVNSIQNLEDVKAMLTSDEQEP